MPQIELRDIPPAEAVAFFEKKSVLLRQSFAWQDVWQEEHARQFTVAKSAGRDILGDIYSAVLDNIKNGVPREETQKQLTKVLQDKGWWGQAEEQDPQTGDTVSVQLGTPRRVRTIIDTNVSMAYAAGRWERIQRTKAGRPYITYDHLEGQEHPRPLHAAWNGVTLPVDDPWWRTHYPPNGWFCHCWVTTMSEAQYQQAKSIGTIKTARPGEDLRDYTNNRTGQTVKVPAGVDPGFGYNVGVAHVRENTPPPLSGAPGVAADSQTRKLYPAEGRPQSPAPRSTAPADIMSEGMPTADYLSAFMSELEQTARTRAGSDQFAINDGAVLKDPLGLPLALSERFLLPDGGAAVDNSIAPFVKLLARALLDPDEIWMSFEPAGAAGYQLQRRYVSRWLVGERLATLVVEESKDGWRGITSFSDAINLDDAVRVGWLAYQR